jgi:hypothetical protein
MVGAAACADTSHSAPVRWRDRIERASDQGNPTIPFLVLP